MNSFSESISTTYWSGKVDPQKGLFVIGAWANTKAKEDILIHCIMNCRECVDSEILLVTHLPVSEEIQSLVDYYIYDEKNPLLLRREYDQSGQKRDRWYDSYHYHLDCSIPYKHDYAIWTSFRNAFNFAKYLNKENIYYIEFDMIVSPVEFKREFIIPLIKYKVCLKDWDVPRYEKSYFTNIFSAKTDVLVDCVNRVASREQFYSINKSRIFELVFPEVLLSVIKEDEFFHIKNTDGPCSGLCSILYSKSNVPGFRFKGDLFFCKDKEDYYYVFFDLRDQDEMEFFVEYGGVQELIRTIEYPCFNLMGLDYESDLKNNFLIKDGENVILKKNKKDLIEEGMFGSLYFKDQNNVAEYRRFFKR